MVFRPVLSVRMRKHKLRNEGQSLMLGTVNPADKILRESIWSGFSKESKNRLLVLVYLSFTRQSLPLQLSQFLDFHGLKLRKLQLMIMSKIAGFSPKFLAFNFVLSWTNRNPSFDRKSKTVLICWNQWFSLSSDVRKTCPNLTRQIDLCFRQNKRGYGRANHHRNIEISPMGNWSSIILTICT